MAFELVELLQFKTDVLESVDYYYNVSPKVAANFINDLENTLTKIELNPYLYSKIDRQFHRALLNIFPHKIIFTVEDNVILIVAQFHVKRNPKMVKRVIRKRIKKTGK